MRRDPSTLCKESPGICVSDLQRIARIDGLRFSSGDASIALLTKLVFNAGRVGPAQVLNRWINSGSRTPVAIQ